MKKNTTKKKLTWKLSKLPTPNEVVELVKDGIITKEEAKEILFATEEEKDHEDLKKEIQFLKKLVEKLSEKRQIVETIRWIEKPYKGRNWFDPYDQWVTNIENAEYDTIGITSEGNGYITITSSFSSI